MPDERESHPPSKGSNEELSLKRYDTVFRYLAYENTVFWSRSQFFLVANAGMFGFVATKIPTSFTGLTWPQIAIPAIASIAGMLLSYFWCRALTAGEYWIRRWEGICESLEPEAFGTYEVLRNCRGSDRPKSGKVVARHSASLFIALWLMMFAYLMGLVIVQCAALE
jgi:hypothetical protein